MCSERTSSAWLLGGSVSGGSNDIPWGQRVAHVEGPDGNR